MEYIDAREKDYSILDGKEEKGGKDKEDSNL
jgi:hypothetical protein